MGLFNKVEEKNEQNVLEQLDAEIARCLENMKYTCNDSEGYTAMAKNLKNLYKARSYCESHKGGFTNDGKMELLRILLPCGTALVQVVLMMLFETSGHVFTTKALGFLFKPRI